MSTKEISNDFDELAFECESTIKEVQEIPTGYMSNSEEHIIRNSLYPKIIDITNKIDDAYEKGKGEDGISSFDTNTYQLIKDLMIALKEKSKSARNTSLKGALLEYSKVILNAASKFSNFKE